MTQAKPLWRGVDALREVDRNYMQIGEALRLMFPCTGENSAVPSGMVSPDPKVTTWTLLDGMRTAANRIVDITCELLDETEDE